MAHFAQLDENNIVTQVIVVNNNECLDENGNESEAKGIAFCQALYGAETRWVQTSYNDNFRKRYAGIGFTYNQSLDAFIKPKPNYPSWIFNSETADWEPPVPRPPNTVCRWDEFSYSWIVIPSPFPSWVSIGDPPFMWVPPVERPFDGKIYRWDEPTISWIEVSQP